MDKDEFITESVTELRSSVGSSGRLKVIHHPKSSSNTHLLQAFRVFDTKMIADD